MLKKINVATVARRKVAKSAERWVGNSGLKRLTIDLEPDLHQEFKQKAAGDAMTMREIMIILIKEYVRA